MVRGLELSKRIPALPIYVDSPMACSATTIFQRHPEVRDAEALRLTNHGEDIFQTRKLQFSRTRAESKRLNELKGPAVIISASGMATGGRILHHLALRLPHAENIVLFVGYQAEGTRGRSLIEGAAEVKIQGQYVPVRAKIMQMEGFSAHADYSEILRWLGTAQKPPKQLFLIHGEDDARAALAQRVATELAWPVHCPRNLEEIML
jgi:metallo-beta-lactamase family protein